ncbi:glutaredoxin family protein [Methyloterricola oryzae]|uniref:glutaredoxin family protein n=1 Tax=Methyloterricola oryzae TaxID=1495050 RepID=UPI00190FF8EF|nr:glutaredoxin family protein [Methyloterricola oryzae]
MSQSPVSRLVLFSTEGCHLCEEALALLIPLCGDDPPQIIEIAEDDSLLERYGSRIPVLRERESGRELDWPFGADELQAFL